jgi:c-di-GMP-binding flagellar brake protein YcgR
MPATLLLEGSSPVTLKRGYDQRDQSLDTNGNVRTKLRAGKFESYQVKLEIASGQSVLFREGDVVSITAIGAGAAVKFEWQEDVQVELSFGKTIATGTLKKEDTMTYA